MKRFVIATLVLVALGTGCGSLLGAPPTLPPPPTPVLPTLAPFNTPTPITADTSVPVATPQDTSIPTVQVPTIPTVQIPTAAVPPAAPPPTAMAPSTEAKRISFPVGGTSAAVQGSLGANGIDRYVLRALVGQTLAVNVTSPQGQMLLSVNGANGDVYKSSGAGSSTWSGTLRTTQDYFLTISTPTGSPAAYTLVVTIPPLTPTAQDVPQRIQFGPGGTSATVSGSTSTPGRDRFVINAQAGQTMTVSVTPAGSVILIIYGADGNVLISDHAGTSTWSGTLPTTEDYFIDTRSFANSVVPFNLTVTIPPIAPPPPIAKRITFPPGGVTATVPGTTVNGLDRWVVKASGGQTMIASIAAPPGQAALVIFGADGTVLISDHAGATNWTGILPSTQDYIIDIKSVGASSLNYTLTVTIPPR